LIQVKQLEGLLVPVLYGCFATLVQQQEDAAAGRKALPHGKLLGSSAQPGSAIITGQPTGINYRVTAQAQNMFKGQAPASIAAFLADNLKEENAAIKRKYQVTDIRQPHWTCMEGHDQATCTMRPCLHHFMCCCRAGRSSSALLSWPSST
jgi:hypothetical protein